MELDDAQEDLDLDLEMEGVLRAQEEEVDFTRLPDMDAPMPTPTGQVAISATLPFRPPRRLEDFPLPNNSPFPYGRIDAGVESNLGLVQETSVPEGLDDRRNDSEVAPSSTLIPNPSVPDPNHRNHIARLPTEIISRILAFVDPTDLTRLTLAGRNFSTNARHDNAWHLMVQNFVPGVTINRSWPCASYKDLFISLDPYWFLPKYKIWFADSFLTGRIILVRYDPRRGSIEGYQLVAERCLTDPQPWAQEDEVMIHSFCPHVRLHLDQPVLQLHANSFPAPTSTLRARAEIEMPNLEPTPGLYSILSLARTVNPYPGMQTWPSQNIPAYPWHRVRNVSHDGFRGAGHRPDRRVNICDQAFRIRRGFHMPFQQAGAGIHRGEDVQTYSTLDPRLYTPTADKPWRGIFVGDYSGHGCEFILMHQPEIGDVYVGRRMGENDEDFAERQRHERVYRGSIQAIKLTGDPNVPRGETTFVAPDIGEGGCLPPGIAPPFEGTRIVRSKGHAALRGFTDPKWIDTQLLMVSHDLLAQLWSPFGHINYFQRVDIDQFLIPGSDPRPEHHLRAPSLPTPSHPS